MLMERYLQKAAIAAPCVTAPVDMSSWLQGVLEQPGTRLLAPSTGKNHWSFKRARWIIAWCVECLFCLKTYLKYPAKHAKCYRASPACSECMQVRPLPKFALGSARSQKEEYQPLSRQNHSLRYLVPSSVYGILNCCHRLSAHTHTHTLSLWLERAEERHPFYPGKQSSYSEMTFTVLLLSRHAQNTHITPQLKTLSLLLCNCWVFFSAIWKLIQMTTGLATVELLNRTLATSWWVTAGLLLGRIPVLTSHIWYRWLLFWLSLCFNRILW